MGDVAGVTLGLVFDVAAGAGELTVEVNRDVGVNCIKSPLI